MILAKDPLDVDCLLNDGVGMIDVEISPGSAAPSVGTLVDWRTPPDADAPESWNSLLE